MLTRMSILFCRHRYGGECGVALIVFIHMIIAYLKWPMFSKFCLICYPGLIINRSLILAYRFGLFWIRSSLYWNICIGCYAHDKECVFACRLCCMCHLLGIAFGVLLYSYILCEAFLFPGQNDIVFSILPNDLMEHEFLSQLCVDGIHHGILECGVVAMFFKLRYLIIGF